MEALRAEVAPFGIHTTIVNPGLLPHRAAHGAVDAATPSRPIADYDERRAPLLDYWQSQNGQQSGDPAKLAQALLTIASQEPPPRRFIAGADAIGTAEQKDRRPAGATSTSNRHSRRLSPSTLSAESDEQGVAASTPPVLSRRDFLASAARIGAGSPSACRCPRAPEQPADQAASDTSAPHRSRHDEDAEARNARSLGAGRGVHEHQRQLRPARRQEPGHPRHSRGA